jgi:glycosyltransferase involved in cell wall biosynthesis
MDVIYFKTSNSSFVLIDKRILEENFDVTTYHINNKNGFYYIFSLLKLFLFLSIKGWRTRVYFIRFADWHTALIALFGKLYQIKVVIVVGGFDAFHLPEYAYGVYHQKFRGLCARYALRNASVILPNNPSLIESTNYYAGTVPVRGGIKYFEPRIKGRIEVVYNGFDTTYWTNTRTAEKKNVIITVAIVKNLRTYYLKGVDSFIELARQIPDTKFKIIGVSKSFLERNRINIPPNLEIIEFLPHKELLQHYREARVFCLFSLTEGMSNVLCEAMLCECIPVGTNITFIPEIIGNTGFIVKYKNIEEMKQKVEEALKSGINMGKMAKQRILEKYSLENREIALTLIIKDLVK